MIFYEFSRASFVDFFYQSFVADWLIFKTPRLSIGQTLISTLTKFLFNWATMKHFILTQWRGDWSLSIAGLSVRIDLLVIFIIVFLLALYTNLKTGSFVEINFSTGNTGKKKTGKLPHHSSHLWQLSHVWNGFLYWGHYMAILRQNERNAKKDKTVLHLCVCSICCILKENDIH